MKFHIRSKGIVDGYIQDKYGKHSNDITNNIPQLSIPLEWEQFPVETKSFAIVIEDFDNIKDEGFSWIHWIVANIPSTQNNLEEDFSRKIQNTNSIIKQGKNTWIVEYSPDMEVCNRYGGPAPEKKPHEYEIKIYALSKFLNLTEGFYYSDFRKQLNESILAEAVLYGKYQA